MHLTHLRNSISRSHSLSNTLWFYATRETLDKPLVLKDSEQSHIDNGKTDKPEKNNEPGEPKHEKPKSIKVTDCSQPDLCTDFVLDTIAGLYTCRQRMDWYVFLYVALLLFLLAEKSVLRCNLTHLLNLHFTHVSHPPG